MLEPLVSIIMPVYNRSHLVARSVESVIQQTYKNWELLIVDDGSTDDTPKALEPYRGRAVLLKQANAGPYAARNLALQQAKGDVIAFIDSDDRWITTKLDDQLPLLRNDDIGLVFGDAVITDYRSGEPRRRPYTFHEIWKPARGKVFHSLLRCAFVPQSSVMVKKECFQKVGAFSLLGKRSADYAKWVQIAQHYSFDFVAKPVFELAVHGSNWSREEGDLFRSQIPLFTEIYQHTDFPEERSELRHFIFNAQLGLDLTLNPSGAESMPPLPIGKRGLWLFQFLISRLKLVLALTIQKFDSRRWFAPLLSVMSFS